MTPQELDAAVAKKLGWTELEIGFKGWIGLPPWSDQLIDTVPNYSIDIAAALQVLHQVEGYVDLTRQSSGNWMCYLDKLGSFAHGHTAPLAICRAFLGLGVR